MKSDKVIWAVIVVSVIQTLVIVYLVLGISNLNELVSKQSDLFFKPIESQPTVKDLSSRLPIPDQKTIDVTILRETIKQELNQYFKQQLKDSLSTSPELTQALEVSSPENIQLVHQQLDLIIAQGGMSNESFETFSAEISKIAPSDRHLAFSRLAKAINNGQVIITN
jgi:hypothetical protein